MSFHPRVFKNNNQISWSWYCIWERVNDGLLQTSSIDRVAAHQNQISERQPEYKLLPSMEPPDCGETWPELPPTQFYDRFELACTATDAYGRAYQLCFDKVQKKQAITRQYFLDELELQDVIANLDNYFSLQGVDGICKIICFSYGHKRDKINIAFDYSQTTLEDYMKTHFSSEPRTYDFFLAMFLDLVYSMYQLHEYGYEHDDFRRDNILVELLPENSVNFKIYLDQRPKDYSNLVGQTAHLLSNLKLIGGEQHGEFEQQRMSVYEMGLLILDVATHQIQDNLYSVAIDSRGNPQIDINYSAINAKMSLMEKKFEDRSLWELISSMVGPCNQRPTFYSLHQEGVRLITPLMSGSFRLSRDSRSGLISAMKSRSLMRESLLELSSNPTKIPSSFNIKEILHNIRAHQQVRVDFLHFVQKLKSLNGVGLKQYKEGSFYFGEMVGRIKQGNGILYYFNGNLFYGKWADDKKIQGTCVYNNGQSYTGQLSNGKCGCGVYRYANGNRYQGEWLNDCRHGKGTLLYSNNQKYEGQWIWDKKHGAGRFTSSNGVVYEGMFANGRKTGECCLWFPDGRRMQGVWERIKQGEGKTYYGNGDVYHSVSKATNGSCTGVLYRENAAYEGVFVDGVLNGICNIHYKNGQKYSGNILNGLKQGKGVYIYSNGDAFQGEWRSNNKHSGTYRFSSGNVFTGYFEHNQPFKGQMVYSSGDSYEGSFNNGLRQGIGTYTKSDGEVLSGRWMADQYVPNSSACAN